MADPVSPPPAPPAPPPPPPPADARTLYKAPPEGEGDSAAPPPPPPAPEGQSPPPPPPAVDVDNPLGGGGEGEGEGEGGETPPPAPAEGEVAERASAYKLNLPDGFTVDEPQMTAFRTLAAEANLPQEQAQGLIDLYVKNFQEVVDARQSAVEKTWNDTLSSWKDQIAKDPQIGGVNREAAMRVIGSAMDKYGSKEARQAFDLTGAGQHPAVIRFIHNMAKALGEGKPVIAQNPGGRKSRTLYQTQE